MKITTLQILTSALLLTFSCSKKQTETVSPAVPDPIAFQDKYTITSPGLYPEGIDFDFINKRFLVSSLTKSGVYAMSLKGEFSSYLQSNTLYSVAGVFTDEVRNRFILVSGDMGVADKTSTSGPGSIAIASVYNLTTSELIREIDLKGLTPGAGSFPNDIAVDQAGNIYVTDSFSPVIYKINSDYEASVFVTDTIFQPSPGGFGLNGIVYHEDGYLLVAKTDNSLLFKIPLANPKEIQIVEGFICKYPDGLEWTKDKQLIAIENGLGDGKAYTFSSNDQWSSVNVKKEILIGKKEFPTTAALTTNGDIYVISSKLGSLLNGDKSESSFQVQKIK